jgi:hypothetical protein
MAAEPAEWRGVVAVQYGTVILADADGAARGLQDPDGTGLAVLVDAVSGDGEDGLYVRWRDDAEIPT